MIWLFLCRCSLHNLVPIFVYNNKTNISLITVVKIAESEPIGHLFYYLEVEHGSILDIQILEKSLILQCLALGFKPQFLGRKNCEFNTFHPSSLYNDLSTMIPSIHAIGVIH